MYNTATGRQIITRKEVCDITANVNAKKIWLNYFNNTLLEKGLINKNEYNKMVQLIRKKCHTPPRVDKKYNEKSLKENY